MHDRGMVRPEEIIEHHGKRARIAQKRLTQIRRAPPRHRAEVHLAEIVLAIDILDKGLNRSGIAVTEQVDPLKINRPSASRRLAPGIIAMAASTATTSGSWRCASAVLITGRNAIPHRRGDSIAFHRRERSLRVDQLKLYLALPSTFHNNEVD